MSRSEDQKASRRKREKLARLHLSLAYIRKLVKAQMKREGTSIASEDIPQGYLEVRQAHLAVKRALWDRPAVLPEQTSRK